MAADHPGQACKMAYLEWKRLNFIQKGQNESRFPMLPIGLVSGCWVGVVGAHIPG